MAILAQGADGSRSRRPPHQDFSRAQMFDPARKAECQAHRGAQEVAAQVSPGSARVAPDL